MPKRRRSTPSVCRTSGSGVCTYFCLCAPTRDGSPHVPDLVFLLCVVVLFELSFSNCDGSVGHSFLLQFC